MLDVLEEAGLLINIVKGEVKNNKLKLKLYQYGISNNSIKICTLLGQDLKLKSSIVNNEIQFDVSNLENGIYFFQILNQKGETLQMKKIQILH